MSKILNEMRIAEVKAHARVAAPQFDPAECAAALLVVVFDERIREHMRSTQPRLWDQILHALGPLTGPAAASFNASEL